MSILRYACTPHRAMLDRRSPTLAVPAYRFFPSSPFCTMYHCPFLSCFHSPTSRVPERVRKVATDSPSSYVSTRTSCETRPRIGRGKETTADQKEELKLAANLSRLRASSRKSSCASKLSANWSAVSPMRMSGARWAASAASRRRMVMSSANRSVRLGCCTLTATVSFCCACLSLARCTCPMEPDANGDSSKLSNKASIGWPKEASTVSRVQAKECAGARLVRVPSASQKSSSNRSYRVEAH
mmetsp:Transcript_15675/g.51201  ORF Transcript_15675/g.51201 Transcript_15675/m.51201 type:complete len:242 (-) Transcript_15675:554-1279(-)